MSMISVYTSVANSRVSIINSYRYMTCSIIIILYYIDKISSADQTQQLTLTDKWQKLYFTHPTKHKMDPD
jgi:hypothetical protein